MVVPSSAIIEVKTLNEINDLKRQTEQNQQKIHINLQSSEKISCSNKNYKFVKSTVCSDPNNIINNYFLNSKMLSDRATKNVHVTPQLLATNVHVNPNFKPQKPTVHINPNIRTKKPLVHVNPKMMHNIAGSNQNVQNNVSMTDTIATKTNINNTIETTVKRSIYVNPTLLKKLSSPSKEKPEDPKESIITVRPVCSRLKFVKNIENRKNSPKKTNTSNIMLLSRRKLVRVSRTVKSISKTSLLSQCRSLKSTELIDKKSETQKKVKALVNDSLQFTKSNVPKSDINKLNNKSKITKYKIDRTALAKVKRANISETRKVMNNAKKLVTIGGIVYKASKNKLVRRSCSLKRKRSISGKGDKSSVATNDKRQRINKQTLNCTLEANISKTLFSINISPKATYKNSISNKAKQRSIRILRNKMHKNNQPCLIFQRFGSCPNHENGICPKRHDKKQVSLCKNFLQGKCFSDKCSLSHDIGPEKMPTCKYFLDGCCTRDACRYLHVKVSSNTSICIDFLQGYCAKGNKCQRRHEYLCPEFHKSGSCSKGECPYPHKSYSSNSEKNSMYLKKTRNTQKYLSVSTAKDELEISNQESRLRYYELSDSLSGDFERKREISFANSAEQIPINETSNSLIKEGKPELETTSHQHTNKKRRAFSGSYIPIDSF